MPKEKLRSTLLHLIEVGQLARSALLAPLLERGLEPGDEMILFALADAPGQSADVIAEILETGTEALGRDIARLVTRDLVSSTDGALHLTERGVRFNAALASAWAAMEAELQAELAHKQLKALRKSLRALDGALRGGRPN